MTKNSSNNQIFISYAREDDEHFVKRLYEDLIKQDIRVWWDRKAMESRGRTFLQELRDAIEEVDRVIFVVGPKAVQSEYCRAELEHALLFAKGIVPILRMGEYSLVPPELAKLHCPDFRESRSYDESLEELLAKLAEPVTPLGPLRNLVPALPPHFMPRTEELACLSQMVLADVHRPTVVTSAKQVVGLHGMGGSGKSVLASAFARATETRRAFAGGIVWLSVGQQADPLQLMQKVGLAFKDDLANYITIAAAQAAMTDLLADKVCLMILDDVWEIQAITPFRDALCSRCRILLTTRDAGIVTGLAAQEFNLDVLTDEQALMLLAEWSDQSVGTLPEEAKDVARECGNLPLALAMIGASVRGKPNRWSNVLHRLQSSDLDRIQQEFPNYPYHDLLRAFDISLEALDPEDRVQSLARVHYSDFAVFPENTAVPETTLEIFWKRHGLDEFDAQDVIDLLVDRSLVQRDKQGCLRLHDLQVDYARNKAGDLKALHRQLLSAYAENCPEGWHSGPDDGYFFQQLLYHLNSAERVDELRQLLMDFDWLKAKLEATDATTLLRDYDWVSAHPEIDLILTTIKLSMHVLAVDRTQLASQLIGRLLDRTESKIKALLDGAIEYRDAAWFRPLTSSLTVPGDPLIMTLTGHKGGVSSLAVIEGKRQLVSCGGDVKVWDLDSGKLLKTVVKPESRYSTLTATSDGQLVVLGSDDKQVEVWETGSDSDPRFLGSHSDYVAAADVTPDGKYAISGSGDGSISVWNITTHENVSTIKASEKHITAIAISPDARIAVSASGDGSLKVWDIHSGELSFDLKGHKWLWVESIAITGDGRQLLSASTELKLWNLENGELLRTIESDQDVVGAVAMDPKGQRAISGSIDHGNLKLWDLSSGAELLKLRGHRAEVSAVALTSDCLKAISASYDGTIRLWDLQRQMNMQPITEDRTSPSFAVITPDGRRALTYKYELEVWDPTTGNTLHKINAFVPGDGALAITKNGRLAATSGLSGTINIWDLDTGNALLTIEAHKKSVSAVALSQDGRRCVTGSRDNSVKLWDLTSGKELRRLNGHSDEIEFLTLSMEGKRVVSGSNDGHIIVWNFDSGDKIHELKLESHEPIKTNITASENGRRAITFGLESDLVVWDVETGSILWTLKGHSGWMVGVKLTSEGHRAVSWAWDNSVRLWDLNTGSEIAKFCTDERLKTCVPSEDGTSLVALDSTGKLHTLQLISPD